MVVSEQQITFELEGAPRTYKPTYPPAVGMSPEYVITIRASGKTGQLIGFIGNEAVVGNDAKAFCSDSTSDHRYTLSIHVFVDGTPYTGCCSKVGR